MKTFRRELMELINRHSKENGSNTPDFILAEYLIRCLNTFDHITTIRNEWYGDKLLREKIRETRNEFEKEIDEKEEKIIDDIDFNNLCARATLYPGKSIEEVEYLQYVPRLEDSYKFINSVLLGTTPMNDKKTRQWATKTLAGRLSKFGVVVRCNEGNNPPEIIDENLLIARVMRNSNTSTEVKYVDLVFGTPEAVKKYTLQRYADQQTFNFIKKGI